MAKVLYTEQQRFTQLRWIWFLTIPILLSTLIFMLNALYQQLILNEPWGNEPISDAGLIGLALFVISSQAIMFWILLSIRLEIEISEQEFRYKFFSYFKRWNVLTHNDIADYSFVKNTFGISRGVGYHKNIFAKTTRMNISGKYLLVLNTAQRKTILLSTQNKEEAERAMSKLMSKSQNHYQ